MSAFPADDQARITELEIRCLQLQRDFDQLNQVVIDQQREIERLTRALKRFDIRLEAIEDGGETRDPLAERPPHY